jgi:hypothetical protein
MHCNGFGAIGEQSISKDLVNPAAKGKFKKTELNPNTGLRISEKSNHEFAPRLVLSKLEQVAQSVYFYLSENPPKPI